MNAFEETAAGHEEAGFDNRSEGSHSADLTIPGDHNRLNAAGALIAAVQVGANVGLAAEAIAGFKGAEQGVSAAGSA